MVFDRYSFFIFLIFVVVSFIIASHSANQRGTARRNYFLFLFLFCFHVGPTPTVRVGKDSVGNSIGD